MWWVWGGVARSRKFCAQIGGPRKPVGEDGEVGRGLPRRNPGERGLRGSVIFARKIGGTVIFASEGGLKPRWR